LVGAILQTDNILRQFPFACNPQEDEVFSSWFFRLSKGNLIDATKFARFIFRDYFIFRIDCDIGLPEKIRNTISDKFCLSREKVDSLFLNGYVGNYLTEFHSNGHDREVLSGRTRVEKRNNFAQQFCPLCLDEEIPYFRRKWRLTAITVCLKHSVVLSDRCRWCLSPANCHRLTWMHSSSAFCFKCGRSLTNQIVIDLDDLLILRFQEKLEQAILSGWYELSSEVILRTPVFLEGLRFLIKPFFSEKSKNIYTVFHKLTKLPFTANNQLDFWPARINCQPTFSRFKLYIAISWLLDGWPYNFIKFCKDACLTPTSFFKTDSAPPYWLVTVFDKYINKKNYWVSSQEIKSAVRYLYKNNYYITASNVGEAVGLDRSMYLTSTRRRYLKRVAKLQGLGSDLQKVFKWKLRNI
jgi:TniQ